MKNEQSVGATLNQSIHDQGHQHCVIRNYLSATLEGGFFIGSLAFVSIESVLPILVDELGGAPWIIATLPTLMLAGISLTPLFTAHLVEGMERLKPYILVTGCLQRIPFLVAGITLWLFGESNPALALTAVILAPLLCGLAGGFNIHAWAALIIKVIPTKLRVSVTSMRTILGTIIGIVCGYVIDLTLTHYPDTKGYAILHAFTFLGLLVSYISFLFIKEENKQIYSDNLGQTRTLAKNLLAIPSIMRAHWDFRMLFLSRILDSSMMLLIPFMSIHAIDNTNQDIAFSGSLVTVFMLGGLSGNILSAIVGNKIGTRNLLILSRLLFMLMIPIFVNTVSPNLFLLSFFLCGFSFYLNMVAINVIVMEMAPVGKLPTYMSIIGIGSFTTILMAALISSNVYGVYEDAVSKLAHLTLALMALSTLFLLYLKTPSESE